MALISFDDREGQGWQVWRVTPASSVLDRSAWMEPEYRAGWLCFESLGTGERRRLAPVPDDWHTLPPERLELLLKVAKPARRGQTPTNADAVRETDAVREADGTA